MIKTLYEKEYSPLLDLFMELVLQQLQIKRWFIINIPEPFMMLSLPLPLEKT